MSECNEHKEELARLYKAISPMDSDAVIPMLVSVVCGIAAQTGVPRDFFTRYVMETISDAYDMFTRDESEAVH